MDSLSGAAIGLLSAFLDSFAGLHDYIQSHLLKRRSKFRILSLNLAVENGLNIQVPDGQVGFARSCCLSPITTECRVLVTFSKNTDYRNGSSP